MQKKNTQLEPTAEEQKKILDGIAALEHLAHKVVECENLLKRAMQIWESKAQEVAAMSGKFVKPKGLFAKLFRKA